MHLISATSSELLRAVVNSAYLSERDLATCLTISGQGMANAWLISAKP